MTQATDSQIAMWRGMIALAWVDGTLDENEKQSLLSYFNKNIYLSDTQRALLIKDMDNQLQLKDVWSQITDTQDRAHLIDLAPSLFLSDGDYSAQEHAEFNEMFAKQMATVDIRAVQQSVSEIKANISAETAQYESIYRDEFNNWGFAGRLIYHFNKMLGMDII